MRPCLTLSIISGAIQGMKKRPPLHLGVVAIEKEAFGSQSTNVANLCVLLPLLSDISHIDCTLQKRLAVPQSALFCILYWLGLFGILLMHLSVPNLIIPSGLPLL